LHRGLAFNNQPNQQTTPTPTHFSPLFIGDSRSTKRRFPLRGQHLCISVPSSSGTRVQRSSSTGATWPRLYFSPLFIGDSRSTAFSQALPVARNSFQSPLHRGLAFNH